MHTYIRLFALSDASEFVSLFISGPSFTLVVARVCCVRVCVRACVRSFALLIVRVRMRSFIRLYQFVRSFVRSGLPIIVFSVYENSNHLANHYLILSTCIHCRWPVYFLHPCGFI